MALELFVGDFGGDYRYEIKSFFSSAAEQITTEWPDPAGLGQPVSDGMNSLEKQTARAALRAAENNALQAIQLEARGKTGEALQTWQTLFGRQFSKS